MNAKELNDTAKELENCVNKYYWYNINERLTTQLSPIENTQIIVFALASKLSFGRILIQIVPVFGTGSFWVKKYRLKEITNPTIHINGGFKSKEVVLYNHSDNAVIKLSPHYPEINLN